MLIIPDWVDSEQWLYQNMPSKNSQYYGNTTRQRGRILRVSGLSGLGAVVNPEVTNILSQHAEYNKALAVNSQLSQRIATLDQNIAQWKSAKVIEKDRVAALKVLNDQRNRAVSDQTKVKDALAKLMVAADQDIKEQSTGDKKADAAADAAYKQALTVRLNNLIKARADAVAEVEPAQLPGVLSTIDGQIVKIRSQIRSAGGSVRPLRGLSGLGVNYWYEDYPTDYPVYVNGLGDLGKFKIKIKAPKIVRRAAEQVKGGVKRLATNVRNITKKLPGANYMSKLAAKFPLTAPIVRLTGTKKQKKLAVKGLKALAVVAAVVAAVLLAPIVVPSLAAAASAAASAVGAAAGAVGGAIGAGAGAIGAGAAAVGSGAAALVGGHAVATGLVAGGAALALKKKKKKRAPGQTAPLPGETVDDYEEGITWGDVPETSAPALPSDSDQAYAGGSSTFDETGSGAPYVAPGVEAPTAPSAQAPYVAPGVEAPTAPSAQAPYVAPGVEAPTAPSAQAPYIAPASAYSGGGGSGGGPGPLDTGDYAAPQAATDVQLVADEKKPEAPKSNTVKYLLAVGGLAAVGGLTYYFITRK